MRAHSTESLPLIGLLHSHRLMSLPYPHACLLFQFQFQFLFLFLQFHFLSLG